MLGLVQQEILKYKKVLKFLRPVSMFFSNFKILKNMLTGRKKSNDLVSLSMTFLLKSYLKGRRGRPIFNVIF